MRLRKKLIVWGAFLAMGLIITGCEEESVFDSVVAVEETTAAEESSAGNFRVAKNSIGDALLDLLGDDDEEAKEPVKGSEPGNQGGNVADMESGSSLDDHVIVPSTGSSSSSGKSASSGSSGLIGADDSKVEKEPAAGEESNAGFSGDVSGSGKASEKLKEEDERENGNLEEPSSTETETEEEKPEVEETETHETQETETQEPENQGTVEPETETHETEVEEQKEVEEEESSDSIDITVLVINEAGVKFGMISVIDPLTNAQRHIGSLGKDEMFIMEIAWPVKEKHFRIGIYDEAGNLIKEEVVDFKHISSGSVITLRGSGSLSDIIAEVE